MLPHFDSVQDPVNQSIRAKSSINVLENVIVYGAICGAFLHLTATLTPLTVGIWTGVKDIWNDRGLERGTSRGRWWEGRWEEEKKKTRRKKGKKKCIVFVSSSFHCIQRKGKGSRSPCLKEERCSSIRALAAWKVCLYSNLGQYLPGQAECLSVGSVSCLVLFYYSVYEPHFQSCLPSHTPAW